MCELLPEHDHFSAHTSLFLTFTLIFHASVVIKNHAYVWTSPRTCPFFSAYITFFDVYADFLRFNHSIMTGIRRNLTNSIMTETCLKNCKALKIKFFQTNVIIVLLHVSALLPTANVGYTIASLLFPGMTLFFQRKRLFLTYKIWRHGLILDVFVVF
jgi:hypothetical protein